MKKPEVCKNCGETLSDDYCSHCGQKAAGAMTFRHLMSHAYEAVTDIDTPVFKTFIELSIKPGVMVKSYLDGARIKYLNPFKYSFLVLTVLLLVTSFRGISLTGLDFDPNEGDAVAQAATEAMQNIIENGFVYFFYFNCLLYTLVTYLFFLKEKRNLTEIYIFYLYIAGHATWLPVIAAFTDHYNHPITQLVIALLTVAYMIWAVLQFYGPASGFKFFKAFVLNIVAFVLLSVVIAFAAGFYVGYFSEKERAESEKLIESGIDETLIAPEQGWHQKYAYRFK